MKLTYNKDDFSQKCYAKNLEWHTSTCDQYSSSTEKIKILEAIKSIMEQGGLSEQEACARFKVEVVNFISSWTKNKEVLQDPKNSKKLRINQGPCTILEDITQNLVDFVEKWHGMGLPVNCFNLIAFQSTASTYSRKLVN